MTKIVVKYRCGHLSCRNPTCYQNILTLPKERFDLLKSSEPDPLHFRSPSGYCKIGGSQQFQILDLKEEEEEISKEKRVAPAAEVLKILKSKLEETIAFRTQALAAIEKADTNILELQARIDDLVSKMQKRE
jgi:hypothetical protein